jgi:hypothetical protein
MMKLLTARKLQKRNDELWRLFPHCNGTHYGCCSNCNESHWTDMWAISALEKANIKISLPGRSRLIAKNSNSTKRKINYLLCATASLKQTNS